MGANMLSNKNKRRLLKAAIHETPNKRHMELNVDRSVGEKSTGIEDVCCETGDKSKGMQI